jgi:hypothetical protein
MATGVQRDKQRKKSATFVDLTTPHGAEITVSEERAASLLNRGPVRFNDQVERKYVPAGEDNTVKTEKSGATPPRTGNRTNTEDR